MSCLTPDVLSLRDQARQFAIRAFFMTLALALIAHSASAQNGGNFVAGINFAAGAPVQPTNTSYYIGGISPVQVVSADFNDDKRPDLVVAASCYAGGLAGCPASGSVVAVYLSNGNGTFQPPILNGTKLPPSLRSIVVGDFNHDGYPDVAAAADCLSVQDCSSGSVTILLGDGKGNLTQSSQYPIHGIVSQTNTLAVGQFTEGGNLDLVVGIACYNINVTGCTYGSVTIFPGDGTGKLGTPKNYQTVGNATVYPVVDDFNGDGNADVEVLAGGYSSVIAFLQGNGNGTFKAPVFTSLPSSDLPTGLAAADFNGDHHNDLAILTYSGVEILIGLGNGKFQSPVNYSLGYYNSSISLADLNGDGKTDLVVGYGRGGVGTNAVIPLMNNGSGAFAVGATYSLGGWNFASVALGDFNGDSKQDIVLTSSCSETSNCPDGALSLLLGNGNGTMQGTTPAKVTIQVTHQLLVDINGDGIPDMVGTENYYRGNQQNPGAVVVALGIGGGKFGPSTEYPSTLSGPTGLAVADLNGDGYLDVVMNGFDGSSCAVAVFLGGKGGSLGSSATYPLPDYTTGAPAIGDFAGNKKPGIAVVQQSQSGGASGVGILLGNGDGTLQAEKFTETTEIYPDHLVVGDFNKDGKADVAVSGGLTASGFTSVGAITVFLGKGDGTLTIKRDPDNNPLSNPLCNDNGGSACVFPASYPSFGLTSGDGFSGSISMVTADLSSDGNLDLIIANQCRTNDSGCSTGELVYFHGNGDGTFNDFKNDAPAQELADANYLGVAVADVNSDGKPDIVASTLSGVAVYLAPFTKPGTIYATSGIIDAEIPAIADINGDGAPDIAISNGVGSLGSAVVDLLFNRFPRDKSTTTTLTSSANPSLVGQSVTFTAKVTAASGGTPTGNVDFTHNGVFFTTSPLVNGVATFTTSTLIASTGHNVTATYAGSATDATSVSKTIVQQVYNATATTLASSLNPSKAGQSVTLTAKVTASSGGIPAGTVTFKNGTATLATVALSHGAATLTTTALPAGTLSLTAAYAPNSPNTTLDAASTSAALKQVVKP
jgi:hypothetical protein